MLALFAVDGPDSRVDRPSEPVARLSVDEPLAVLIRDTGDLGPFRDLFGDSDESYESELKRHYSEGPPPNSQESYVSTYATMHP